MYLLVAACWVIEMIWGLFIHKNICYVYLLGSPWQGSSVKYPGSIKNTQCHVYHNYPCYFAWPHVILCSFIAQNIFSGPFNKYDTDRFQDALVDRNKKYGKIVKETIAGNTVIHLFDPDYIRTVFRTEGKHPFIVPLMETTQMYRQQRGLTLGIGNT